MKTEALKKAERLAVRRSARETLAIARLAHFIRYLWPVVEPGVPLDWNWHLDAICEELEAVARGETRNLVIMVPPGTMKSLLVAVFYPAWRWIHRPSERAIYLSNDDSLVERDSLRCRDIIRSDRYLSLLRRHLDSGQAEWGRPGDDIWTIKADQDEKMHYKNSASGFRQARSIRGKITGKRSDVQVVDDPYDAAEAEGADERTADKMEEVVRLFNGRLRTRLNDQRTGARIVVMQRLHEKDLAGVLAEDPDWRVVCIPMEYLPDHPYRYDRDPRTEEGELLDPVRFPQKIVDGLRRDLGSVAASAQLDQLPRPGEGGHFKKRWFIPYSGAPMAVAATMDDIWLSVDAGRKKTAKNTKKQSFNVIQSWGFKAGDPRAWLLHERRGRWDYTELEDEFEEVCRMFPRASQKLIEDQANGTVLIQRMRTRQAGIIAFDPASEVDGRDKSKEARAKFTEVAAEAGQILIPDPTIYQWSAEWLDEHVAFGAGGLYNDRVDTTSQVMVRRAQRHSNDLRERIKRLGRAIPSSPSREASYPPSRRRR